MADQQVSVALDANGNPVAPVALDANGQPVKPSTTPPNVAVANAGVESFGRSFDPTPAIKSAWNDVTNGRMPGTSLANALVASSLNRIAMARQAMAQGDHAGAALHYAGAIPVIGGPVDDLAQALRNGDDMGASRAMGQLAALTFPAGADTIAHAAADTALTSPTVANAAQTAAEGRVAEALGPQNGWGRSQAGKQFASMADDAAPAVLRAGPVAVTRKGVADFVDKQAEAASTAWDAAEAQRNSGHVAPTAPIIAEMQAQIDALTPQPVQGSRVIPALQGPGGTPLPPGDLTRNVQTGQIQPAPDVTARPLGQPVEPTNQAARIAVLRREIGKLQQLGPVVSFDTLRKLRKDTDVGSDYSPSIAAPSDQNTAAEQSAAGNSDAAAAYRNAMVRIEPDMAPANANLSIALKAQKVVTAADDINRTATKGGNFASTARLLPAVLGAGLGSHFAGVGGAEGGALGGTFLTMALDAASRAGFTTKVATARVLDQMASAIRSGNAPIFAKAISDLASVTGTTVPLLNNSLASPTPGPQIQTPSQPINVAINGPGGGTP